MIPDAIVAVHEKTDVAAARRAAFALAGWPEESLGPLGIVITEAATNLIKHAGGGQIIVRRTGLASRAEVEVIAVDKGPGLANPARAFEDGYSTAGSPGTGLGAIRRLASFFDYYSAPQKGTVLLARVAPSASRADAASHKPLVEYGAIGAAYPGEDVSGDSCDVSIRERMCRIVIADGLGHGLLAAEASDTAVQISHSSENLEPAALLEKCHGQLRATRGAAMSVANADFSLGTLSFAGVGNVAGAIAHDAEHKRQMLCINGTVGHEMRKAQPYSYPLPEGSLVVMHSDGLSSNWGFEKYPGLFHRHPSVVAGVLFRDFRRDRDDATVVVVRAVMAHASRTEGFVPQ